MHVTVAGLAYYNVIAFFFLSKYFYLLNVLIFVQIKFIHYLYYNH